MLDSFFPEKPADYLRAELDRRQRRSAGYSLRAFARDLAMSPSAISELLNEKVGLSPERARDLANRIKLEEEHHQHFCDLITAKYSRRQSQKQEAELRILSRLRDKNSLLALDQFRLIADWYHFAILELLGITSVPWSIPKVAACLEVPEEDITQALDRLQRLELIQRTDSFYVPTSEKTKTGDGVSSKAVRLFHRQILEKATVALEEQPIETRDFQSHILAIREQDVPAFRDAITRMTQEIFTRFVHHEGKNTLYAFSTQLFRINKEKI